MALRTPLNNVRFTQWVDIMRQLRPSLSQEEVTNLVPWRYKLVTALRDNKVVGVGAYYPTASLIRGKFNYLADLVTDSTYRSTGIGAQMMDDILDPNLACELDSGLEKVDAHRFYERLGFAHTGYAVRPQVAVVAALEDLPLQPTYLIDGMKDLASQSPENQKQLQAFIDENANAAYQGSLENFMRSNPDHRLLALENEAGKIEGVLLYELQNRLSFGGNCFHVTDLIVKDGTRERQNALLLSLLQYAKECNAHEKAAAIKTVVIEMTEEDLNKHEILKGSKAREVSDNIKVNMNTFFSATAKHFIKPAGAEKNNQLPTGDWYKKSNTTFT